MNIEDKQRISSRCLLQIMWKLLQNFVDTFNTLTTGLDIRATSQHLHTSISPDKITVFTGAVAIASKTNTSAGQNVMTINDIKWIMTDHVRYWQTNTDIEMLKHGVEEDRMTGYREYMQHVTAVTRGETGTVVVENIDIDVHPPSFSQYS